MKSLINANRQSINIASTKKVTRFDILLAGGIFILSLILYIRTLAPGLLLADSAEFQTLVYTLGMTHATGYPVYLLAAHGFTLLPFGNLAYRVNLFSAVCGSLTLTLVYLDIRLLAGRRLPAFGAALAMGLSAIFWWQAVIAEVYTASSVCLTGILLLILLWRRNERWIYLFAAGVLGGLSLGVHLTVALSAPGVLVYLWLIPRNRRAWLPAIGGAVLGLVLTFSAFLYIDSVKTPTSYIATTIWHGRSVWGLSETQADSFIGRMSILFTGRQFQLFMFTDPIGQMQVRFMTYMEALQSNFSSLVPWLAAVGILALLTCRQRWREGVLILLVWIFTTGFILNYGIGDIQVFYISSYVWLVIATGLGGSALIDGLLWIMRQLNWRGIVEVAAHASVGVALIALLVWSHLPVVADAWKAGRITFLEDTNWAYWPYPIATPEAPYRYAVFTLDNLEDDAIVFTTWDRLYTYYYVAHLEQGRTSLSFHEWFVQDGVSGIAESTFQYIDANLGKRPIYFADARPPLDAYNRYDINRSWRIPWLYKVSKHR